MECHFIIYVFIMIFLFRPVTKLVWSSDVTLFTGPRLVPQGHSCINTHTWERLLISKAPHPHQKQTTHLVGKQRHEELSGLEDPDELEDEGVVRLLGSVRLKAHVGAVRLGGDVDGEVMTLWGENWTFFRVFFITCHVPISRMDF